MDLKLQEARFLYEVVTAFCARFERTVVEVLAKELRNVEPVPVRELREQLQLLLRQLESRQETVPVHEVMAPLVKRVLLAERRQLAEELERPLAKASDPAVVSALGRELRRYDAMLATEEIGAAAPQGIPRVADFLSIRFAAEAKTDAPPLMPRVYDEKFHILEAPTLFFPDLAHYRDACSLRGASLAVAFLDIDDFKAVNERLGETTVDHTVLGPFMELVEAWIFARGHAYRFGGDEYLVLLPNATASSAAAVLSELRERLARATYRGTKLRVSVSSGVAVVDPDCHLTDREVLGRANAAKARAKSVRKGSVVVVAGPTWDVTEAPVV